MLVFTKTHSSKLNKLKPLVHFLQHAYVVPEPPRICAAVAAAAGALYINSRPEPRRPEGPRRGGDGRTN